MRRILATALAGQPTDSVVEVRQRLTRSKVSHSTEMAVPNLRAGSLVACRLLKAEAHTGPSRAATGVLKRWRRGHRDTVDPIERAS
jgi:hypothetical protein